MMSRRRAIILVGTAAAIALDVGSYARCFQGEPHLGTNLPAASLPSTSLPQRDVQSLESELTSSDRERYGITADSYDQARLLARTEMGELYLIPGSDGACLLLADAAACGNPGASDTPLMSLFVSDTAGDIVGGVVVVSGVKNVDLERDGAVVLSVPVKAGVFSVTSASHIAVGSGNLQEVAR